CRREVFCNSDRKGKLMTTTRQPWIAAAATLLTMLTANTLSAGQIMGVNWYSGVASVAGTAFYPPSVPNNDDVVGSSPNGVFVTQKDYVGIGPVDLVFDVSDNG